MVIVFQIERNLAWNYINFAKPGIENLQIRHNVEEPKITDHDVLVRVRMCCVNPK
jgi:NADPH:quinone reductase-like Zn-dependent oxidoreductase